MSFFTELKRRNVFRVAILYLVAGWLILQVADVGVSLLGLPTAVGRFIFLLLAIVFPLVLIFSWADRKYKPAFSEFRPVSVAPDQGYCVTLHVLIRRAAGRQFVSGRSLRVKLAPLP